MIYIGITPASARGYYALTPTSQPWVFVDPRRLIEWAMAQGDDLSFGVDVSAAGSRLATWLHQRGYRVRWLPVVEGVGVERAQGMARALAGGAGLPYHARQAARMLASADALRRQGLAYLAQADRLAGQAWGLVIP